jgi:hypothetical protein
MAEVPMCRWCGEFEVGMFAGGSEEFCSVECIDSFDSTSSVGNVEYDTDGEPIDTQGRPRRWPYAEDMMAHFDDDPSPYAGTYSED